MKIIFSGGGTLGPVIPLLAVAEVVKQKYPRTEFIWVGTKFGPERQIVENAKIPFYTIGAGKWRRYFSLFNILDLLKIIAAFFQSVLLLIMEKPNMVVSAGGFVSVPLHWAAAFLGIPAWVHQQDAQVGLANKLMFSFAKKITTAVATTACELSKRQAEWIGNPSRDLNVNEYALAKEKFNIPANAPVVFAMGGGTGSASINKLVLDAMNHWPENWHIIHLVGKERPQEMAIHAAGIFSNYHAYDFFVDEMKDAYAVADVVIARAGFGTLTELASLSKAAVILPMFDTHQEENARIFAEQGGIILLDKKSESGIKLAQIVKDLMANPTERTAISQRLHMLLPATRPEKILEIVNAVVTK